jgi:ribosomal protein L37AE/L43A
MADQTMAEATTRAKRSGDCPRCGKPFIIDSKIFKWNGKWVCKRCNDDLRQPTVRVVERVVEKVVHVKTDWVREMFRAVPKEHRQRVYRAMALAFHPDHGGDADMMRRINLINDEVSKWS